MTARDQQSAARVLTLLNPRRAYHRASIQDAERIPEAGAALIVSNHGHLDFDSFILVRLVLNARRRLPRLMADHMWYKLPLFERVFAQSGAVEGTRANAIGLVERGELVLTYPGGVREALGGRFGREHIDWTGRRGFARVAIQTGVPVIPVVGVGVNSGLVFVSSGRLLGTLLFQRLLRLGDDYSEYRNPLCIGIVPVPLPYSLAVALPLPCKITYYVGEPIYPPSQSDREVSEADEERFAQGVIDSMRELIRRHGRC